MEQLVPISEAESSHKVKDVLGSVLYPYHENSSDDLSWKIESDPESNSSSGSSEAEEPEEPAPMEIAFDGHIEETKGGKRGGADAVGKRYKLRPRNANGTCRTLQKGKSEAPQSRSRKTTGKKDAVKKEKPRKFSVALTQEEIASDIFAMTGKKPSSRPPKRDKKLQQILDVRKILFRH